MILCSESHVSDSMSSYLVQVAFSESDVLHASWRNPVELVAVKIASGMVPSYIALISLQPVCSDGPS